MNDKLIFDFKADISGISIPESLNNPFGNYIPKIAQQAAVEFQAFIDIDSESWQHDFRVHKGKMFGVLVIQKSDKTFGFLGTVSGKLEGRTSSSRFVPSSFDESTDDFFINRGMTALTQLGKEIQQAKTTTEINDLRERRKQKSYALQRQLFENYKFLNLHGEQKNVIQIFEKSPQGNPPAAAGECAAPKLLQYTFQNNLKPIAFAEFWWGKPPKSQEREHKRFYPACKDKCRPILEYMLDDDTLFELASK